MTLDELIELWALLVANGKGGVAVTRGVAVDTLAALRRLELVRDSILSTLEKGKK